MIRNVKIEVIPPGSYVVAVSGGVDSMVLLDLLRQRSDLKLIVAHVNHGMRETAERDAALVRQKAAEFGLPFEQYDAHLGADVSEGKARYVRYNFLRQICKKYNAALVTAHHQDDLCETIIINLLRGTGWRGLCSLASTPWLRRPLLMVTKTEILAYANEHGVQWHEDETNQDQNYLRNYVRYRLLPEMRRQDKDITDKLVQLYNAQLPLRQAIETEVSQLIDQMQPRLKRYLLIMWPEAVALECIQSLIAGQCGRRLLTDQAKRALLFAKTGRANAIMQPAGWCNLHVTKDQLIVEPLVSVVS